jgi:uncharacterized coiled-coil protein SlyX
MDELTPLPTYEIAHRIQLIRNQRVMLDSDLAHVYGVTTKALNQAVKRNQSRFPADFVFALTASEKQEVVTNCDHLQKLKFSRTLPFAFTEYGAIALANVLASAQAIQMGIHVVRAFVQLRNLALTHQALAQRLSDLERETAAQAQKLSSINNATQQQLKQVFDALRDLMTPVIPAKNPIGFIHTK